MTVSAMILPMSKLDELTFEQVVDTALRAGLLACNRMQGPFRISFFPRDRVPNGWSVIGVSDKSFYTGGARVH